MFQGVKKAFNPMPLIHNKARKTGAILAYNKGHLFMKKVAPEWPIFGLFSTPLF